MVLIMDFKFAFADIAIVWAKQKGRIQGFIVETNLLELHLKHTIHGLNQHLQLAS